MIELIENTQEELDLAQVKSLRTAGLLVSDIAEQLRMPIGRVQRIAEKLPRNLRHRGADAGRQPAFKPHHGHF